MEKFNLKTLGVNYTVLDQDTNKTDTICVIDADELKAVLGELVDGDLTNVGPYLERLLKRCKGFARSPFHITWYSATQKDFDLSRAIVMAKKEGNKLVVTEVLPTDDSSIGYHTAG